MYLNPEHMSAEFEQRLVRWMEANGCRDYIALEPITIRGRVAEYASLGRKGRLVICSGEPVTRVRRLRLRIPLSKVA